MVICIIAFIFVLILIIELNRVSHRDKLRSIEHQMFPVTSNNGRTFDVGYINNSNDRNHTGRATRVIEWTHIKSNSILYGDLDYNISYCDDTNTIELIFECTHGLRDWISNLTFPCKPYPAIEFDGKKVTLWVHRGWMNMYRLGKHRIRDEFTKLYRDHPDATVVIYGYSLGGSLAQLAAQDINYNYAIKPTLITYGSPKPWFGANTFRYVKSCIDTDNSYQFDNVNDLITLLPPLIGYHKMKSTLVGLESAKLHKILFGANKYHTIYDQPELYQ